MAKKKGKGFVAQMRKEPEMREAAQLAMATVIAAGFAAGGRDALECFLDLDRTVIGTPVHDVVAAAAWHQAGALLRVAEKGNE